MKRKLLIGLGALLVLAAMLAVAGYDAIASGAINANSSWKEIGMHVMKWPLLLWAGAMMVAGSYAWVAKAEAAEAAAKAAHEQQQRQQDEQQKQQDEEARRTLSVQLVGAQMISPYVRRGLPLQAQLPALLNHNPHRKPKPYYAPTTGGKRHPLENFLATYFNQTTYPFRFPFWGARDEAFFYHGFKLTRFGKDREAIPETVNNVPAFVTLPGVFQPQSVYPHLQDDGLMTLPDFSTSNTESSESNKAKGFEQLHRDGVDNGLLSHIGNNWGIPNRHNIRYRFGAGPAGFSSLTTAFDYLEAHPQEVVWFMAADAPGYGPEGKDEQPNEASLLLLLAHRDFDTGREPLAWIRRPVHLDRQEGQTAVARVKSALTQAAARGPVAPEQIGYVFHDAGAGQEASKRIGLIGQAVTETLPEFAWTQQQKNFPGWLGELGATTTPYHLLMAAWAAWSENKPSLVVGITDPHATDAVLVTPPAHYTPPDPGQRYWAARSESDYSRPWWGRRRDGKPDFGMAPMQKDDGSPAKPAAPFELKYE